MCGRFTLFADYEQILERFDVDVAFDEENYSPNFNVAPSQSVISIINDGSSNRLGFNTGMGQGQKDRLQINQCALGNSRK